MPFRKCSGTTNSVAGIPLVGVPGTKKKKNVTYYQDWAAAISEGQRRLIIAASAAAASWSCRYLCVTPGQATLLCDSSEDLRGYRSYETLKPQVICFQPGPPSLSVGSTPARSAV